MVNTVLNIAVRYYVVTARFQRVDNQLRRKARFYDRVVSLLEGELLFEMLEEVKRRFGRWWDGDGAYNPELSTGRDWLVRNSPYSSKYSHSPFQSSHLSLQLSGNGPSFSTSLRMKEASGPNPASNGFFW